MGALNLPNTLTLTRIILIPIFIITIIYKRYDYALCLFIFAALTDMFDGLVARLKNQKTALGTFLDPLADKFLLVTAFIILSVYGWLPKWLAIIIISRDITILAGWFILYLITGISKVEPSLFGKATIWMQSIFIAYVLIDIHLQFPLEMDRVLQWMTAGITILSGAHYIYRGLKLNHAS